MSITAPTTWSDVPAYVRAVLADPFVKKADGVPGLSHGADVLGWRSGDLNAHWGGPRPVSNLLIGAGLGSLGGYAAGRLAEKFLPERYFDPKSVRRRATILGAALGSVVPAYQGLYALRASGGDPESLVTPFPPPTKESADLFNPNIPVDPLGRMLMADPNTPWALRAATAGLLEAADAVRGDSDRFVSPWDVARVTAGAGVGLLSGVVAGKALGLLAGLTPEAQKRIQDIGLWSGVLQSTIPRALGLKPGNW